jgi:hypothetical protein
MVRRRFALGLLALFISQLGIGCCHRHCMRVQARIENRVERRHANGIGSRCCVPNPCDCGPGVAAFAAPPVTAGIPPHVIPVSPTPIGSPSGVPMKMPFSPNNNSNHAINGEVSR